MIGELDPICGMEVSEEEARFMIHFEHETLYFCSEKCSETYAQQAGVRKSVLKKAKGHSCFAIGIFCPHQLPKISQTCMSQPYSSQTIPVG